MTTVHLVTDRHLCGRDALVERVEAALRGGLTAVHLREKDLDGGALFDLAVALKPLCLRHGAALVINDRVDVALAAGADGVHLPADSFRVAEARSLLGSGKIIGVSTHSPVEVEEAAREGADFAFFGPVFATASKARFGAPQGLDRLRQAVSATALPVIAIGGVTLANAAAALATGAAGIAVIAAILSSTDPQAAASAFHAIQ